MSKITDDITNGMSRDDVKNVIRKIIVNRNGLDAIDGIQTWGIARSLLNNNSAIVISDGEKALDVRDKLNNHFNIQQNSPGRGYFAVNEKYPLYAFDYNASKVTRKNDWKLYKNDEQIYYKRSGADGTTIETEGSYPRQLEENEIQISSYENRRGLLLDKSATHVLKESGNLFGSFWSFSQWEKDLVDSYLPNSKAYRFKNDGIVANMKTSQVFVSKGTIGVSSIYFELGSLENAVSLSYSVKQGATTQSVVINLSDMSVTESGTNTYVKKLSETGPNQGDVYVAYTSYTLTDNANTEFTIYPTGSNKNIQSIILHGSNFTFSKKSTPLKNYATITDKNLTVGGETIELYDETRLTEFTILIEFLALRGNDNNSVILSNSSTNFLGFSNSNSIHKVTSSETQDRHFKLALNITETNAKIYNGTSFINVPGTYSAELPFKIGDLINSPSILIEKLVLYAETFTETEMINAYQNI